MNFGGMGNMLKQAQQMQARMAKLKEELAERSCEASAGGGAVIAVASGDLQVKSITIDPELAKSGDAAMLQDLVLAAVNQALAKAQDLAAGEMSKITGGFKLPF
jgi:hypothetical protein